MGKSLLEAGVPSVSWGRLGTGCEGERDAVGDAGRLPPARLGDGNIWDVGFSAAVSVSSRWRLAALARAIEGGIGGAAINEVCRRCNCAEANTHVPKGVQAPAFEEVVQKDIVLNRVERERETPPPLCILAPRATCSVSLATTRPAAAAAARAEGRGSADPALSYARA
ncbi:unnamed protein product [Lampetra planeri]